MCKGNGRPTAICFDRLPMVQTGSNAETSHTGIIEKLTVHQNAHGLLYKTMWEIAHVLFFMNRLKLSATFHFNLIVSFHEPSAKRANH
jgi:hypothetical protein